MGRDAFVGGAVGVNASDSAMDNQGGIDSDGLSLLVYGTKSIRDNLCVDGTVGVGQFDYDTRRNLNYTATGNLVNQQSVGSTEADLTFTSAGVGFDSAYGQDKGILLSFFRPVGLFQRGC